MQVKIVQHQSNSYSRNQISKYQFSLSAVQVKVHAVQVIPAHLFLEVSISSVELKQIVAGVLHVMVEVPNVLNLSTKQTKPDAMKALR